VNRFSIRTQDGFFRHAMSISVSPRPLRRLNARSSLRSKTCATSAGSDLCATPSISSSRLFSGDDALVHSIRYWRGVFPNLSVTDAVSGACRTNSSTIRPRKHVCDAMVGFMHAKCNGNCPNRLATVAAFEFASRIDSMAPRSHFPALASSSTNVEVVSVAWRRRRRLLFVVDEPDDDDPVARLLQSSQAPSSSLLSSSSEFFLALLLLV